jgi:hypothetical protein
VDNQQNGLAALPVQPAPQDTATAAPRGDSSTLTIVDLLRTSRELSEALTPLTPRADFRAGLHDELIQSAQRQYAQRILAGDLAEGPAAGDGSSRRLVWSAAAVGLSSAVSVISVVAAYYWRRRVRRPEDRLDDGQGEDRKAA